MGSTVDPGGGNTATYARSVKTNKFQKLNRNVLQIVLEKKMIQKNVNLNCAQVVKICEIVGIRVGSETEGYQAHYNRKNITLSVWAKDGVSLERFVTDQSREFSGDLTITQVRPAYRREVTLIITGLSFNTPDSQVKHYVESFGGKMVGIEPIYGVYRDGPWKGQYNGDRRYKVDVTGQIIPMGTYHLINNDKVRVAYPGNTRTCGRCHQAPISCPGGGIARVCGEQGGEKKSLLHHMKQIWSKIKYDPENDPMDNEDHEEEENTPENHDIPDLADMNDASFEDQRSAEASGEQLKNEDDTDNKGSEDSQEEDEEESDNDEDEGESPGEHTVGDKYIIPGLPKPLTKNQKKKLRKNKRKGAITPPEATGKKAIKLSVTPEGSSLVTELIRKYSSAELYENENDREETEESEDSALSPSSGTSSQVETSEITKPSSSSFVASSTPGSVIQPGVL